MAFAAEPQPTNDPLKIVFATVAAGGSHVSTAHAMKQALGVHFPGQFDTQVREIMPEFGFEDLDERHKQSWRRALRHPWSVILGQKIIDTFPRTTIALHRRMLRSFAKVAAKRFRYEAPALIVANHPWLVVALTQSQREFGLGVPVVAFQTGTLNATALWADPAAERFVSGSPVAKNVLIKLGVPGNKIDVVGYPVRQPFLQPPSQGEARQQLRLRETFTVLVLLGGEGVGGKPEQLLRTLRQLPFDKQIVVIGGRNPDLKAHLGTLTKNDPSVHVTGFVDNMAHYLSASDVVVGKAAAAAGFEALAVGRPILATYTGGGPENDFAAFLEDNRLGGFRTDPAALQETIRAYHDEPERLEHIRTRTRDYDFPGMSHRLACYLAHYAVTGHPDLSQRGSGITWTSTPSATSA